MKRRDLTEEERRLWQEEAEGKPLKKYSPRPAPAEKKLARPKKPPVADGPLNPMPVRKAQAAQPIEATLDLHGLTQTQAHGKLERFILAAARTGKRRLLVITGKGSGALKRNVPLWLEVPKLREFIASIGQAPREKGGEGALLVLLKKPI